VFWLARYLAQGRREGDQDSIRPSVKLELDMWLRNVAILMFWHNTSTGAECTTTHASTYTIGD
jgi:hypothetical protein